MQISGVVHRRPTACMRWHLNAVNIKQKHIRANQVTATHHTVLLEGHESHAVLYFVLHGTELILIFLLQNLQIIF